jgi:hypothetical protein
MTDKNSDTDNEQAEFLFGFERFELYQRSVDFADKILTLARNFPDYEKFELSSQLRRASISIS